MKLFNYIKKYVGIYVLVFFFIVANVVLELLNPQITKSIVNDVLIGRQMNLLRPLLIGFLVLGFGKAVASYFKEFLADFAASGIARGIRRDLFKNTEKLSASYFDKNNAGETMSRIKSDVDKMWDAFFVITLMFQMVLHVSMVLVYMYSMNWRMAILPTILMICAGLIAVFMERRLDEVYGEIDEEDSVLNDTASENLAGVRTVKAFAREKFEIQKFFKHNNRYNELNIKQSKELVRYYPFFQFISFMIPVIVLIHGGIYVIQDKMTLGELTAYIQYSNHMTWPMEMMGWIVNSLAYGVASWKRIKKLYNEKSDIVDKENAVELKDIKGAIEFCNVGFERNGNRILKDVNFSIGAGETLGIMGETGSGKTSIVNLMTRIYDVSEGCIKLDGHDIRDISVNSLRQSIAPVTQDVFLFSDSIKDNIKFGSKKIMKNDDVENALKAAEADFVWTLPQKEQTVIGERGVGLSGGQKQRLTIARALSKKRPIIVFDDSTSALDMETEQKLQKTINGIGGMTKVIIAHRISSVRHADKIIVLEKGTVAECGTHEELMEKKGIYYSTYMSQYGDYLSAV